MKPQVQARQVEVCVPNAEKTKRVNQPAAEEVVRGKESAAIQETRNLSARGLKASVRAPRMRGQSTSQLSRQLQPIRTLVSLNFVF